MLIIGCDFHPKFQQISMMDTTTEETKKLRLEHTAEAAAFYRSLRGQTVRVGLEATGSYAWFRRLLQECGHQLWLGDPAAIHAANPRKQRNDKRDADCMLTLLHENRFPQVWMRPAEAEDLRQLLVHRVRMVQIRTKLKHQLDSMAKNEGLITGHAWRPHTRTQLEALSLPPGYDRRRRDLLDALHYFDQKIQPLTQAVEEAAQGDAQAALLMTHPWVGPNLSLAFVVIVGPWQRFANGRHLGSYLGLIPCEDTSADKRRLGHITKQGNVLLRWLLTEAAQHVHTCEPAWHRLYGALLRRHQGKSGVAKVAVARKLAIRLYWMLRCGQSYEQIRATEQEQAKKGRPSGPQSRSRRKPRCA